VIDLAKLKAVKVSAVPLGHLALYFHDDGQQLIGVRVNMGDDDAGLVMLRFNAGRSIDSAVFSGVGDDPCLHIGSPVVVWDGNAASITVLVPRDPAPLVLTHEGPLSRGASNTRPPG